MTYKLKTYDPRCHYCGKPLQRATESHYKQHINGFKGEYRSKREVEAARLTNEKITSVRKGNDGIVWMYNTWDGESYYDDMFCTQTCGYLMGRAAVRHGLRIKQKESA